MPLRIGKLPRRTVGSGEMKTAWVLTMVGLVARSIAADSSDVAANTIFFETEVKPVLKQHEKYAKRVDPPVAALIRDLKARGMLEDTLVVFCTEFGRTP